MTNRAKHVRPSVGGNTAVAAAIALALGLTACADQTTTAQPSSEQPSIASNTTRAPIHSTGSYRTQSSPLYTADQPATSNAYTPRSGSQERRELMDAIRIQSRPDLGSHAVFVVRNLRSNGRWAFAQLEPQHPDGRSIDPASTPYVRASPHANRADISIDAIWRKQGSGWQVYAYQMGASDLWWLKHCGEGFAEVLPGC